MNWSGAKTPAPRPLGVDTVVSADTVPAPAVWTSGCAAEPRWDRVGPFTRRSSSPVSVSGIGVTRREFRNLERCLQWFHCVGVATVLCRSTEAVCVCVCVRPEVCQAAYGTCTMF